jgi:organic hydroperoxide reductase OsmC/OhrA
MSHYEVTVQWHRQSEDFGYESYNRRHLWTFPDGVKVVASAAPEYRGEPGCVDPEEAFVASLSSCHMLTFLAIASRKRYTVERYTDHAEGFMEKNAGGKLAVTRVILRPEVLFGGEKRPTTAQIEQMHHTSHEECFIANSVRTAVEVAPVHPAT